MKTTTITELARELQTVLGAVASGEEVEVTSEDRVVAKLIPADNAEREIVWPDFGARARTIVGDPKGAPPSKLIVAERGERL